MKRKEYIRPESKSVLLDASVCEQENFGGHSYDDSHRTKRNDDWDYNRDFYDDDCDW